MNRTQQTGDEMKEAKNGLFHNFWVIRHRDQQNRKTGEENGFHIFITKKTAGGSCWVFLVNNDSMFPVFGHKIQFGKKACSYDNEWSDDPEKKVALDRLDRKQKKDRWATSFFLSLSFFLCLLLSKDNER